MPTILQQRCRACLRRMQPFCFRLRWVVSIVMLMASFSEAANKTEKLPAPAWPPPPAEPRVIYVRDICGP